MKSLIDAARDLLLGGSCLGCGRAGRMLCTSCRASIPAAPYPAWPTPVPPGLAPPWAVAAYAGLVRDLVVEHKERRALGLAAVLAQLLAKAVAAGVSADWPVVLVPVPSRKSVVRARGHDATLTLVRRASVLLQRAGYDARPARLVVFRHGVADQAGLSAADRAANLAGSTWCPGSGLRPLARWRERIQVVVCDDVITTGASAREVQRALEGAGLPVTAIAVVAATVRQRPGILGRSSGVSLSSEGGTD